MKHELTIELSNNGFSQPLLLSKVLKTLVIDLVVLLENMFSLTEL